MPLPISGTTTEFITLAEVKKQANIPATNTAADDELERFRSAAQEHVEALIGPVLHRTFTETVRASGGVVVLRHMPVVSVASLTSSGTAVTHTLDGASGLLTGVTARGDLSVEYVAGRSSAPDAVRVAALIIAADLWRTQRGDSPRGAMPGGGEPLEGMPGAVAMSVARQMLEPYMLPPAVA